LRKRKFLSRNYKKREEGRKKWKVERKNRKDERNEEEK
jgi:hypothetical protein